MVVEWPTPEQRSCSGLVSDIARERLGSWYGDFFLRLWLGYLVVSKPVLISVFCRATGMCMCGIGRERRSSRPSHDTSGCWAFCPLWVAVVPSWCLWCREEQDCHQVCYVCLEQPQQRVVILLSLIVILGSTVGYVGSGVTPTMRTRRCFEHSTCGSLVRVM